MLTGWHPQRVSCAAGVTLNFTALDPLKALYWSAVINGVLAAPIMTVMMLLVRRKSVMGELVVRGPVYWLGWIATATMFLCIVGMACSIGS
jgi:Mn2+/Fe2+ NRAMP family transporter